MQQWLQYAPTPPDRGKNSYDVFISYRSSDRAWAMALYDALKLAHWDAFLDQYDLVPGANLATSLMESLQASSAGVILWSSRTKDSKWCQRERDAMVTLADRSGGTFKYVFAKLDAEELPLFAMGDLYTDFGDAPEGPRGVNLLRLMCGMRGVPLAADAVKLAEKMDQATKACLLAIKGAVAAGNASRLSEIGASNDSAMFASPGPLIAVSQGLIGLGKYDDAGAALKLAQDRFPTSIRVKQLQGLALRRLKKYQEAIDVLSELKEAGHQDPETMGILAAAWDGRYQQTGKTLNLRKSRDLYRTAFQADPRDYYTGINAASKSLFLGETEEAATIAATVQPLVQAASDGVDFWAACTLGELYLLQRAVDLAARQYQTVIDKHSSQVGNLESTQAQAERICTALGLSEAERKKVLTPFALLRE
jgi:tetratricopeptide (TPR) repeat protein